jgi:hypothetical protein
VENIAQKFRLLLYFTKKHTKKRIAQWAKIRPTWSPCLTHFSPNVSLNSGAMAVLVDFHLK